MAEQKQDDQLKHIYSSCVRIRDVAQKTCQRRGTIGRSGERGSGISVQAARHDDDDDDVIMYLRTVYYTENMFINELEIQKIKKLYVYEYLFHPHCAYIYIFIYIEMVGWGESDKTVKISG